MLKEFKEFAMRGNVVDPEHQQPQEKGGSSTSRTNDKRLSVLHGLDTDESDTVSSLYV